MWKLVQMDQHFIPKSEKRSLSDVQDYLITGRLTRGIANQKCGQ